MAKSFHIKFISILATLALASAACSLNQPTTIGGHIQPVATKKLPPPELEPKPSPARVQLEPKVVTPPSQSKSFALALDKASSAAIISQSAQSPDDWNAVVSQWTDAIALMKAVPASNPNGAIARKKIAEYQQKLAYAKQQVAHSPGGDRGSEAAVSVPVTVPEPASEPPPTSDRGVFRVPIVRRAGGTPVIDVTFNSTHEFEMIVDTGASGTVITQQMAEELNAVPVGKARANTASARAVEFPVAYVRSIEVGGALARNVPVAIAGPELETGLLGHDFFGDYDVTIERDVVEFRLRQQG